MRSFAKKSWLVLITLILQATLVFSAVAKEPENAAGLGSTNNEFSGIAIPQHAIDKGLLPVYYVDFFIRDLTVFKKMNPRAHRSFKGQPITQLNHQFDRGRVFDSHRNKGVAIRMSGIFHFPETGTYTLQALSNDGVSITFDDSVVISDPEQHSDRLSNLAYIKINNPGWVPITVHYYQRKGTAALKLFWKTPGKDDFVPVPPEAYAHMIDAPTQDGAESQ